MIKLNYIALQNNMITQITLQVLAQNLNVTSYKLLVARCVCYKMFLCQRLNILECGMVICL
jgi:hypothetical protein